MTVNRTSLFVATLAISAVLVSTTPTLATAAQSTAGKKCQKRNSLSVSGNKIYKCVLVKARLVWDSGKVFEYVPAVTPSPVPTQLPTPTDVGNSSATGSPKPSPTPTALGTVAPAMAFKPTAEWPLPVPVLSKGPYSVQVTPGPGQILKWPDEILGIDQLHKEGVTGKNTAVAFIEGTNIDMSDPYFANTKVICIASKTWPPNLEEVSCPSSSDPGQSHAEGVAGTITGVHGVAPDTTLISVAAFPLTVAQTLLWVVANADKYGIKAVSISMGNTSEVRKDTLCGRGGEFSADWRLALDALAAKDIAVLMASGNDGLPDAILPPGCMPGPIMVGATNDHAGLTDSIYNIASYSNISSDLDLLAPSTLYSEGLNHQKQEFGGTSQAAPFAAGVFALAKSARPDANMAQIFYFLKRYATPIDDIIVKGIPMIQPLEAIQALVKATSLPPVSLIRDLQVKSGG